MEIDKKRAAAGVLLETTPTVGKDHRCLLGANNLSFAGGRTGPVPF